MKHFMLCLPFYWLETKAARKEAPVTNQKQRVKFWSNFMKDQAHCR